METGLAEKVGCFYRETVPYHVVNSLAQLTVATPIFALYETTIAGMSVDQSMNTRTWAAAITLSGVGYLDAKWRDWVRKRRHIDDNTDERTQRGTDKVSKIAFNLARATATYLPVNPIDIVAGNAEIRDWTKVGRGVGLGVVYGGLFGGWSGYAMDLYRDLAGINPSKRIPEAVQSLSSKSKKALLIGLCVASVGSTGAIYWAVPPIKKTIESVMEERQTKNSPSTEEVGRHYYDHPSPSFSSFLPYPSLPHNSLRTEAGI